MKYRRWRGAVAALAACALCVSLVPKGGVFAAEEASSTSEIISDTTEAVGDAVSEDVGEADGSTESVGGAAEAFDDSLAESSDAEASVGEESVSEAEASDETAGTSNDGEATSGDSDTTDSNSEYAADNTEAVAEDVMVDAADTTASEAMEEEVVIVGNEEETAEPDSITAEEASQEEGTVVTETVSSEADVLNTTPITSKVAVKEISTPMQFKSYMSGVTDGVTFRLTKDLDFGTAEINVTETFSGVLDGANHKIKNARGYFMSTNEGTIKNIHFKDFEIQNSLIDTNNNLIDNCTVDNCTVEYSSSESYSGTLCGVNEGTITNCRVQASLKGENGHNGGIVGLNFWRIENCVFLGNASNGTNTLEGKIACGCGYYGTLFNCYSPDTSTIGLTSGGNTSDHNYSVEGTTGNYGYATYTQSDMQSKSFLSVLNAPLVVHPALSPWVIDTSVNLYPIPAPKYGVRFGSISHGMVSSDTDYAYKGQKITFTVSPDSGYVVKTFKINGATINPSKTNVYKYTMGTSDITVSATLVRSYTIKKSSVKNGSFMVSKSTAQTGDKITVKLSPKSGYALASIKVPNGKSVKMVNAKTYTFVVGTKNCVVTVVYYKTPVKTSITKISTGTKAFTVSWTKKTGMNGYQISYSTKKSFSSSTTKNKYASASSSYKKISGLSQRKTYYVRIRTYTLKNGKKVFSGWSSVKSVKTN